MAASCISAPLTAVETSISGVATALPRGQSQLTTVGTSNSQFLVGSLIDDSGVALFSTNNFGVWRTDGTPTGTYQIAAIRAVELPGSAMISTFTASRWRAVSALFGRRMAPWSGRRWFASLTTTTALTSSHTTAAYISGPPMPPSTPASSHGRAMGLPPVRFRWAIWMLVQAHIARQHHVPLAAPFISRPRFRQQTTISRCSNRRHEAVRNGIVTRYGGTHDEGDDGGVHGECAEFSTSIRLGEPASRLPWRLLQVITDLNADLDHGLVFDRICHSCVELTGADAAGFLVIEGDQARERGVGLSRPVPQLEYSVERGRVGGPRGRRRTSRHRRSGDQHPPRRPAGGVGPAAHGGAHRGPRPRPAGGRALRPRTRRSTTT